MGRVLENRTAWRCPLAVWAEWVRRTLGRLGRTAHTRPVRNATPRGCPAVAVVTPSLWRLAWHCLRQPFSRRHNTPRCSPPDGQWPCRALAAPTPAPWRASWPTTRPRWTCRRSCRYAHAPHGDDAGRSRCAGERRLPGAASPRWPPGGSACVPCGSLRGPFGQPGPLDEAVSAWNTGPLARCAVMVRVWYHSAANALDAVCGSALERGRLICAVFFVLLSGGADAFRLSLSSLFGLVSPPPPPPPCSPFFPHRSLRRFTSRSVPNRGPPPRPSSTMHGRSSARRHGPTSAKALS